MKTNQKGVALRTLDWLCERIGVTPASIGSQVDLLLGESRDSGPFMHSLCFPVHGQRLCVAFVFCLNLCSCPSAITRFVVTVYINAVNRVVTAWRFANVSKERLKAFAPPVAHGYTSPSIDGVVSAGRVVAPSLDVFPCAVFLRSRSAQVPTLPVSHVVGRDEFSPKTPARLCESVRKAGSDDSFFCSATANTRPLCDGTFVVYSPVFYEQATKSLTGKINKFHFFTLKWFTVVGAWQAAVNSFSGATLAKRVAF